LITLRSATIALPIASADRQRVLAVSVLVCESVLSRLDGRRGRTLSPDSERALDAVPEARQWADRFTGSLRPPLAAFRRQAAPHAVRYAVDSAAHALIPNPDATLRRMLVESIEVCAAWTSNQATKEADLKAAALQDQFRVQILAFRKDQALESERWSRST
jgi:hypothetical protein